ncbi:MAG: DUF1320 domain-containing protein [Magnetococcales bacterium]|nr:DUF1320 domain-containing protein [Magnetococcales bacterium]
MSYATSLNLLEWFGAKELAQAATPDDLAVVSAQLMRLTIESGNRDAFSLDEQTSADAALARITAALTESSLLIDSYISRRYSLPITEAIISTSPLPRFCGAMARRLLYDDGVPKEVEQRYELTLGWLKDLANNQVDLGASSSSQTQVGAGLADFETNERIFDKNELKGFISSGSYQS